jgi:hypothetical protein
MNSSDLACGNIPGLSAIPPVVTGVPSLSPTNCRDRFVPSAFGVARTFDDVSARMTTGVVFALDGVPGVAADAADGVPAGDGTPVLLLLQDVYKCIFIAIYTIFATTFSQNVRKLTVFFSAQANRLYLPL